MIHKLVEHETVDTLTGDVSITLSCTSCEFRQVWDEGRERFVTVTLGDALTDIHSISSVPSGAALRKIVGDDAYDDALLEGGSLLNLDVSVSGKT